MPGSRLDGGGAVGVGFSGGGKGGGGSFPDPGLNVISGVEDTAARRTEAAGRSGRAYSREVKGVGGRGGEATGGAGRRFDSGGVEDTAAIEGERRGCSRAESSGGSNSNMATGAEKDTGTHAQKRQKMYSTDDVMFATPQAQPCFELITRNSTRSTSSMSSPSCLEENSRRYSSAKRTLEFQDTPYHQKLHDLFVCPLDLSVSLGSLADYAARHRKVNMEIPPGDVKGDTFLSPVNDTRSLIRRSVRILELLHERDKSLGGKFDFSNFRLDTKRKVKLNDIRAGNLVTLRKSHSEADYQEFALQVHVHFFSTCIPSELKGWLKLLLEDPTEQEYLIVHSISLMEPTKAVAHFLFLYGELLALRKVSPIDYAYVVDYLHERHPKWKKKARNNRFTEETLTREDPETKKQSEYEDEASDLLRFCRNFIAHILGKHKGRGSGYRISYGDILAIINSVFPGLLFDFQTAMHHRGILKRLIEFQ